ncbi:sigma-70 family RNA polymerase sigma factor [Arcicella sp. DC2W]|uniref:Sigma-70 family RNA polymerase sigma factor n=1 Tax=Arcicella gelida TaxID=2984195 RepID=A0ABU5S1F4_9BACT|nr:sigma-70 family RNA polymerase sigma factor [Arcicella sp. DC2W]MEA5402249.1 sigma-70 family RNA polymerase sigma factor [Arcicella sp. DC2W]
MIKRQHYDNFELWQRFKKGDQQAFHLIYKLNHKVLVNYGSKITQDIELVRDTVQDLFVNLWLRKHNLADTDNIEPYLKTSLRHDLVRKITESRNGVPFDNISELAHQLEKYHFSYIHENEEREEMFVKLEKALLSLPSRVSQALKMRYFDKMGNQEIASKMSINYQSVNNNIHRGVETLRIAMTQ